MLSLPKAGGLCAVASSFLLLAYTFFNVIVLPPFESGEAFLDFAAQNPFLAFLDDWLLTTWFMVTMGFALGLYKRLARFEGEALLATALGLLGLLVATVRGMFNIGRLQVIAASYASAANPEEQEVLVQFLRLSEQGDAARNAALVLSGLWVLWSSLLILRSGEFPRMLGLFGVVAGLSAVPAVLGYVLRIPQLTHPQGYLGIAFVLWALWVLATGVILLRQDQNRSGPM